MRLVGLLGILGLAFGLAGCAAPKDVYRYKLIVVLDTPEGEKTGFNVVDVREYCSDFWQGCGFKFNGEAIYIDMGSGRQPLVVLLTGNYQLIHRHTYPLGWYGIGPGEIIRSFYPQRTLQKLQDLRSRDRHEITPDQLPDLVTFRDTRDPNTAIAVDPNNLGVTLGEGVSWRSVTIGLTDEPITTGLVEKLPWTADKNVSGWNVSGITQHFTGQKGWFPRDELIRADF